MQKGSVPPTATPGHTFQVVVHSHPRKRLNQKLDADVTVKLALPVRPEPVNGHFPGLSACCCVAQLFPGSPWLLADVDVCRQGPPNKRWWTTVSIGHWLDHTKAIFQCLSIPKASHPTCCSSMISVKDWVIGPSCKITKSVWTWQTSSSCSLWWTLGCDRYPQNRLISGTVPPFLVPKTFGKNKCPFWWRNPRKPRLVR